MFIIVIYYWIFEPKRPNTFSEIFENVNLIADFVETLVKRCVQEILLILQIIDWMSANLKTYPVTLMQNLHKIRGVPYLFINITNYNIFKTRNQFVLWWYFNFIEYSLNYIHNYDDRTIRILKINSQIIIISLCTKLLNIFNLWTSSLRNTYNPKKQYLSW